jgi:hypothetical protein
MRSFNLVGTGTLPMVAYEKSELSTTPRTKERRKKKHMQLAHRLLGKNMGGKVFEKTPEVWVLCARCCAEFG